MKTILLIGGSVLLLFSCVEASNPESVEVLSDEEMKSRVEVEEIYFEKDKRTGAEDSTHQIIVHKPIDPGLGGCVLPKSELQEDSVLPIPELPYPPHVHPSADTNKCGVYYFPETEAQYPGGVVEMRKFINENIQYPHREVSVQGRVYVRFVIEKDGCITHLEIFRGGISEELNNEALRLIRSMPKWIPAQNNGKVVAAFVRLPISFELN